MSKRNASTLSVLMLIVLALTMMPASAAQEPVQLVGQTTFAGVFTETGFVFSPADWNYCDATATIVQDDGETLVLEVTECGDMRTCTWEFTIAGGGVATGGMTACDPDFETGSLVGDVQLHTGCEVTNGTFPVYEGTWDGTSLSVAGDFSGPCDGGTYWGEAWFWDPTEGWPGVEDPDGHLDDGVTAADGPAHVTFGLDLAVSPAATLPETGGGVFPLPEVLMGLGGLAVAAGLGTPWLRRRARAGD
ncbi:MAG: hypothetical protein PVJ23_06305 [Anaerolineae bacterium]